MNIGTKCKGCVFSVKCDDVKKACSIGKLEAFGDIVRVGEEGFYVDGRFCPFYRTEEWAKSFHKEKLELNVHAETRLFQEVFILISELEGSLQKLKITLDNINSIKLLKPKYVRIILTQKTSVYNYIDLVSEYGFRWSVDEHVAELANLDEAIYNSTLKSYGKYITFIENGKTLPQDYFYNIEDYVNNRMKRLIKVSFDGGWCSPKWVYQKSVFDKVPLTEIKYEDLQAK